MDWYCRKPVTRLCRIMASCGYPWLLLLLPLCLLCPPVCLAGVIPEQPSDAAALEVNRTFHGPRAVGLGAGVPAGVEPALERLPGVAVAAAVAAQPALDAPAPLPGDGPPAAAGLELAHLVKTDQDGVIDTPRKTVSVIFVEDDDDDGGPADAPAASRKRKVSNITPRLSDSLLPAAVQVLIHLVDHMQAREQKMQTEAAAAATDSPTVTASAMTTTTPTPEEAVASSSPKPDDSSHPVITIVQLVPSSSSPGSAPPSPSLIIELTATPNKNSSRPAEGAAAVETSPEQSHDDDDESTEGTAVVQNDVPVVSEETVPMMVNMVPSDTPELQAAPGGSAEADDADGDDATVSARSADEGDDGKRPRQFEVDSELYPLEPHRYVYYPTQFFTAEWNKKPGSDAGFLGYQQEAAGMKDHVDLDNSSEAQQDETRSTAAEQLDELEAELDSEGRVEEVVKPKDRFKPSKQLLKIAKLRFALSLDAKRQNYKKFQGYSDSVMNLLVQTSNLTAREQLGVLLAEIIRRGEIKMDRALELAKSTLEDLEKPDSRLSKALEDIPAVNYSTV